jgi:hypothetical protein
MATQVQWRGGSTAEHATFTGAAREVTVDTQKQTLVVHDGSTVGGEALLREDQANLPGSVTNGIYTPGTNQVAVATNGTGRLFVDSVGNVGTNVTPFAYAANARNFQVNGAGYAALTFGTTDGGTGEKYWRWIARTASPAKTLALQTLDDSGGGEVNAYTLARNGTAIDYHAWNAGGSERLRLTSAGLVGIGTSDVKGALGLQHGNTSPQGLTDVAIDALRINQGVGGSIAIRATQYDSINQPAAGDTQFFNFFFNGSTYNWYERMRITAEGRVGIGSTGPVGKLSVKTASATDPSTVVTAGWDSTYVLIGDDSSGRLLVGTSTSASIATREAALQLSSTELAPNLISALSVSANIYGPSIALAKSRGGGSPAVQSNDTLGSIIFAGHDGTDTDTAGAYILAAVDGAVSNNDLPTRLVFSTTADGASSPTERMRITQTGSVYVNHSSSAPPLLGEERFAVIGEGGTAIAASTSTNTVPTLFAYNSSDTNNAYVARFATGSGGDTRGEIYYNGSQLVYGTSSDYRLKENVARFNDGIETIKQLRPVKYNWIENGNEDIGFIAHEVQVVFPNAVGGEKDAVDGNGKILPQTYDPSKLVPLLTAALQEAIGRIETLEGMVAVNNITIDEQQHQLSTLAARLTALENA